MTSDAALPVVRVVCGPTAAGKSALAMRLAARYGATIVSADSRQVYRGFDVGTAKPTREERARVAHEGIDVAEPTERYSASRWVEGAEAWLGHATAAGRTPVVVGGTGLYIRALVEPLFQEPPLDAARRARLDAVLGAMPFDELGRWARALDPARAALGRTQRLRAIETALLTGERLSDLHVRHARAPRWAARYLLVDPGPVLADRIAARVREMLATGWVEEVERLVRDVPADAPAWKASGYATVRALVDGTIHRAEAERRVTIETRQYAKRQRTWFRHQLPSDRVTRIDPLAADAVEQAARWWEADGTSETRGDA